MIDLQKQIEELAALSPDEINLQRDVAANAIVRLRMSLNRGEIRAAQPDASNASGWAVNAWVKRGILLGFRLGRLVERSVAVHGSEHWNFFDKDTIPLLARFASRITCELCREDRPCVMARILRLPLL